MVYQIRANGVMHLHLKSDFQLGANPIHTRNQHWVDILRLIDREQAAEATDFAEYASGEGFMGEIFNPLLGAVGAIDVDTGVGVSYWRTVQRIVGHACSSVSKDWGRRWVFAAQEKCSRAAHCSMFESEDAWWDGPWRTRPAEVLWIH